MFSSESKHAQNKCDHFQNKVTTIEWNLRQQKSNQATNKQVLENKNVSEVMLLNEWNLCEQQRSSEGADYNPSIFCGQEQWRLGHFLDKHCYLQTATRLLEPR